MTPSRLTSKIKMATGAILSPLLVYAVQKYYNTQKMLI